MNAAYLTLNNHIADKNEQYDQSKRESNMKCQNKNFKT